MSQCRSEGRIVGAAQVDHVVPHRGNRRLFFDFVNNTQGLCRTCGSRKSAVGL